MGFTPQHQGGFRQWLRSGSSNGGFSRSRSLGAVLLSALVVYPSAIGIPAPQAHSVPVPALRSAADPVGASFEQLPGIPQPQAYSVPVPAVRKAPNAVDVIFEQLSRCGRALPEADRWRIAGAIDVESLRYGFDPLFVLALIEIESGCLPTAKGPRGAVGLIQMKPSTAEAIAAEAGVSWHGAETLTRPVLNVRLGLHYLSQLEERFEDQCMAVAAYNMGPSAVARMPRHRARQTRYVRKILARYQELRAGLQMGCS